MTLQAIIVDDEEYSRKSLFFLIQENCPDVHVSHIAQSAQEARDFVASNRIDLAFLDIAMPRETGFDLLPALQKQNVMVIFTTAYDQYALKAIKSNAVDYLLKPIDISELKESVNKAVRWAELISAQPASSKQEQKAEDWTKTADSKSKITLPHAHGYHVIELEDIVYVEADSNYSVFHLKKGDKIVISKPLKEFELYLEEGSFMRIHKSIIINFRFVSEYSTRNGTQVILKDGRALPVSRRKSNEFQERSRLYFQR
ncbi:LytTR family two component transcriptional regulator [Arcticibacter pallidicorallinus]|uniref:LytTR family two component transcriptional regulator n=1 Tax=Arcticibacter pallidicorallinus TaxID=1259464 RepID=A0A2T0U5C8_9SPHI|nr:LytTR family DNA-binding domain-containing protein [Arcticibacter pallidicorallinus]PRY53127.1 LytTR family two component transcriptional regulator [Arcticibacter pallidicorallinus]